MKLPDALLNDIQNVVDQIIKIYSQVPNTRSLLIAISGIDGSGKGVVANEIFNGLKNQNFKVALIGLDAWHNPQNIRFNSENPARHFYKNAFRWDELFNSLIRPLKYKRSIDLEENLLDLKTDNFYSYVYDFKEIDIILLEGIFVFKKQFADEYDFKLWVDCSFDTALKRALLRGQEGLGEEETIHDYKTIYFPAQTIHFEQDSPRELASLIINNDFTHPTHFYSNLY